MIGPDSELKRLQETANAQRHATALLRQKRIHPDAPIFEHVTLPPGSSWFKRKVESWRILPGYQKKGLLLIPASAVVIVAGIIATASNKLAV